MRMSCTAGIAAAMLHATRRQLTGDIVGSAVWSVGVDAHCCVDAAPVVAIERDRADPADGDDGVSSTARRDAVAGATNTAVATKMAMEMQGSQPWRLRLPESPAKKPSMLSPSQMMHGDSAMSSSTRAETKDTMPSVGLRHVLHFSCGAQPSLLASVAKLTQRPRLRPALPILHDTPPHQCQH